MAEQVCLACCCSIHEHAQCRCGRSRLSVSCMLSMHLTKAWSAVVVPAWAQHLIMAALSLPGCCRMPGILRRHARLSWLPMHAQFFVAESKCSHQGVPIRPHGDTVPHTLPRIQPR
jgi:hypothetical protein